MYYIYKITNTITNKIYVGRGTVRTKTYSPEKDSYFGSGVIIRRSLEKYGKEAHKKDILEYCESVEAAQERETFWIKKLDALNPEVGYNLTLDSSGFTSETGRATAKAFYDSLSEEQKTLLYAKRAEGMRAQREQIGKASKERWSDLTSEEREAISKKMSEGWTPELRQKQRDRLLGSKRKSVRDYMVAKYGEERGIAEYNAYLARKHEIESDPLLIEKRKTTLKKTREKCPIYAEINRRVAQPKSAIFRMLKRGTISKEDAEKRLEAIEIERVELQKQLQEWKKKNDNA